MPSPEEAKASSSHHALAINWVAEQVYGHLPADSWEPLIYYSNLFKLRNTIEESLCLIEFHHDRKNRLDLSLAIPSREALISDQITPSWWNSYLQRCDPIATTPEYSKTYVSEELNLESLLEEKVSPSPYIFPDHHIWEFDSPGKQNRSAGIFQRVIETTDCHRNLLIKDLEDFLETQGKSVSSNNNKMMLHDICQSLGCPEWIGFMTGREETLKLVFSSKPRELKTLDTSFWQWFSDRFQTEYKHAANALQNIEGINFRPCFDLSLDRPTDYPRLCFEIFLNYPIHEPKDWKILNCIAEAFSLDSELIETIKINHRLLPFGVKENPLSHLSSDKKIPFKTIAANLSHYKISVTESKRPKFKTYIWVHSQRQKERYINEAE